MFAKASAATSIFSSLLNLTHLSGGGGLGGQDKKESAKSRSNVDLAESTSSRRGSKHLPQPRQQSDQGYFTFDGFLSPNPNQRQNRLSHSQSVRHRQRIQRGEAATTTTADLLSPGPPVSEHRRSKSYVDFDRVDILRSLHLWFVLFFLHSGLRYNPWPVSLKVINNFCCLCTTLLAVLTLSAIVASI
jgi:hypothetical protein